MPADRNPAADSIDASDIIPETAIMVEAAEVLHEVDMVEEILGEIHTAVLHGEVPMVVLQEEIHTDLHAAELQDRER